MNKDKIARTGRVQTWVDDPTSRLPVSCTVFVVQDEMEGPNGIEASRGDSPATPYAMERACAIHLSKLRHTGELRRWQGSDKLVASGPVSFAKIYSTLNEVLRRGGGTYRNGAIVVCHLSL
jgi:ribonucleotide reductase alpha subunit